jgi:hypothetical protein
MRRPINYEEKISSIHSIDIRDILDVDYERLTPGDRTTLCTIRIRKYFWMVPLNPISVHGISIRHENDIEDPKIGEAWSFKRALKLYLKNEFEKMNRCP